MRNTLLHCAVVERHLLAVGQTTWMMYVMDALLFTRLVALTQSYHEIMRCWSRPRPQSLHSGHCPVSGPHPPPPSSSAGCIPAAPASHRCLHHGSHGIACGKPTAGSCKTCRKRTWCMD
ncbi:hypothetical protein GDO81_028380 [Engystomops pustulosus]|uniref:Secreted protein n=1 Tax=Engystomops pustulosus TaxID=76066 RepID=A0AAV6YEP5_ENGPU|nr:hypothetical protein GDO81_028380 [Engystomops pustulosus]